MVYNVMQDEFIVSGFQEYKHIQQHTLKGLRNEKALEDN
jgi:hypothetical protein